MLKIILLLLLVVALKYALQQQFDLKNPFSPQTRNFPHLNLPPLPQLPPLPNISSWFSSSFQNIQNSNQQVHSTDNHPSNNYQQVMTNNVDNTSNNGASATTTTSKTIIDEKHQTTISLDQHFQSEEHQQHDDDYHQMIVDSNSINSTSSNDFCRSPQCVISASKMDYLIDWKVDPCENFYNFACGSFIRDSTLHDRRDSLNVFTMTDDKLKDQLRRLFTRKIDADEIESYKMVKRLFASCMDVDGADKRGVEPLRKLIGVVGGWPMLNDNWNEEAWDLEDSIMKLHFHMEQNKSYYALQRLKQLKKPIQLPSLGLEKLGGLETNSTVNMNDTTKTESILNAYKSYLIDIGTIFGAKMDAILRDIDDAIEFQKDLILLNSRYENSIMNVAFPLFESENYEKNLLLNWLDTFHPLPIFGHIKTSEKKLNAQQHFAEFDRLISKTSKRTLANHFIFKILLFSSRYMTTALKQRGLKYRMELLGVKQKEELWKQCVDTVSNAMQLAVEAMFSKEYFDLESKQTAIDIAVRVKNEFEDMLRTKYSWISDIEGLKVRMQLNEIILKLSFPKELLSDKQVDIFYRGVHVEEENLLESVLRLVIRNTDTKLIISQTNLKESTSAGVLNYADTKDFNKILFPAGVLQREVLSPERPLYLNFPTSGFLIGYIFAQKFEIFQQSNLPSTVSSQIDCLIRQYDSYTDQETGIKNNGRNTLQGNIADNGSLKAVYTAYKKWIAQNGRELSLPALNFTNEQFFWISFAQLFCSISRPEKIKNLNAINSNSFEQFRVIGALSNSLDFANDFKCNRDSPMNPSSKCSI